ncbi:putative exported protein [Shimwellia blattae DSM 4481 = NBRC 105725]|uniref:Putative exported protein n=2 Tax=Shimwellia blattae TaxID=563 RepID=I2BAK0_SHIBC|nr:putative exported protein [Shimwellia blattae DSM 4481 = NBRC 105725]VDY65053.1 Uncharacterized protein conserved in bacteria (DUF2057) [Shimwellia blattae]VEC23438.1 Uncharacterized protein conserved in bacteria (DUF2057) [Shimwellia blattae]
MKCCMMFVLLLLSAATSATTLHLPGDIELLVLDGKRISPSLVRGAEQIELNKGIHQIVLRVERNLPHGNLRVHYLSAPVILTFSTGSARHVSIQPPQINSLAEARYFDEHPGITLTDEPGQPLPVTQDILPVDNRLPADAINYEQLTRQYNLSGKIASQPRFTRATQPSPGVRFSWLRPDRIHQTIQ